MRRQRAQPEPEEVELHPSAQIPGTCLMLAGLFLTWAMMDGEKASELARFAAIGSGLSIALSVGTDWMVKGWRSLVRADVMALCAIYFLTLFEFLFPQDQFDQMVRPEWAVRGIEACFIGFGALAVGRHLAFGGKDDTPSIFRKHMSPATMMGVLVLCVVLGYLHMLIATQFNVWQVIELWLEPRFSQPWGRGKFGDWKALINEMGLLIYLIPPLCGVVLARREKYAGWMLLMTGLSLALTLLYGFSSGTRNIFASYLVTFLVAYLFAGAAKRQKEMIPLIVGSVLCMFAATKVMLDFRSMGLRNYIENKVYEQALDEAEAVFVDYNLYVITYLVHFFPGRHEYLGWEVPYLALVRPVPRALWKDKPEGLSTTMEQVLQVEGLTLASSFIGESYIAAGFFGVILAGLFFGYLCGWWSRMASPHNSDLGILVFASGFFAAVISMRSIFVFTTAVLPTLAILVGGAFWADHIREHRRSRPARDGAQGGRNA
jgi:hypothetical protein